MPPSGYLRMEVQPVAGDVNERCQLEEEEVAGVESAQAEDEAQGATPVSEHVQHGTKLSALGPEKISKNNHLSKTLIRKQGCK